MERDGNRTQRRGRGIRINRQRTYADRQKTMDDLGSDTNTD